MRSCLLATLAALLFCCAFHALRLVHLAPWSVVYSDIIVFYPCAIAPGVPYLDWPAMEYPVLTGLFIKLMGLVSAGKASYYFASAAGLSLATLAATALLWRAAQGDGRQRLRAYWAVAPSMAFFSIMNWDALVLLCVAGAFFCLRAGRLRLCACCLALGFSAKFFPVIYLAPLLVAVRPWREKAWVLAAFLACALAVNLPFLLANPSGWLYMFQFNRGSGPNIDSFWGLLQFLFPALSSTRVSSLALASFAVGYGALIWRLRGAPVERAWFLATLLFILLFKGFSPQFLLWLLPFFVLLPVVEAVPFYVLEALNLAVFFCALQWLFAGGGPLWLILTHAVVMGRHAALVWLLVRTWRETARGSLQFDQAGVRALPGMSASR